MRITSSKKIISEDFGSKDQELITRLAQILNPFLDQVSQALGNQLTLSENAKSKVYRQNLAANVSTLKLAYDLNEKPTSVHVGQLLRTDGVVPAVWSFHWLYASGQLTCTFTGLNIAAAHSATIIAQV